MTAPAIRPMFPPSIDATMLAAFRSCPQKMFRQYVQHWKPASESVHLVAGGAFASGLEAARTAFYIEGASDTDAVAIGLGKLIERYGNFECPSDSAKSLERTAGALEFYFANYPLATDPAKPIKLAGGKHGIEFSFATPLPIVHPVSGDPLLYTGRSDMVCDFAGGIFIEDDKTASSLGASWSKQWEMRSQFTGYCWSARELGIKSNGVLVRGVSILKTKYDTQQAITYRSDYEVERWLAQTCMDIQRMIECWRNGWWDYNLDNACAEYGGCSLQIVCKSSDPETWLKQYFVHRVWDPLAREELTIDQWHQKWPDCYEQPLEVQGAN
jgi:hypothetical protein